MLRINYAISGHEIEQLKRFLLVYFPFFLTKVAGVTVIEVEGDPCPYGFK